MSSKEVYLDYASTTPIDPRVLDILGERLKNDFGNAGSVHKRGMTAKKILDECRKDVAVAFGVRPSEVLFTSGGTESNNIAILGLASTLSRNGTPYLKTHYVTTNVEHSSDLACFRELERLGAKVTYVPVESNGLVDPEKVSKAMRADTVLVSVQYASGEIGVVQPLRDISRIIQKRNQNRKSSKEQRVYFHTDASQAVSYLNINVERLGVDLLSADGHKIYGPKGIGALIVRRGVTLSPIIFGGGQEAGLRPGTENVPLIAGFSEALKITESEKQSEAKRVCELRDYLYSELKEKLSLNWILNGDKTSRLPNNLNISLSGVDAEFLVIKLSETGIYCSTKSACLGSLEGSYVVRALGGEEGRSRSAIRISLGRFTTRKEIDRFVSALKSAL